MILQFNNGSRFKEESMKGRGFFVLLMSLSVSMAIALSACTGSRPGASKDSDQTPLTLAVGLAKDLDDSLDPHKMVSAGTREVLFNVFEGLVKPDPSGNLTPAVAEKYEISPDATVYTFTLRKDILFHNGDPVTASDVLYSVKRCAGMLEEEPSRWWRRFPLSGTSPCRTTAP